MNQQLPVNILKRDPITYYSIKFQQHRNFYHFYDEKTVDSIFNSVKELFVPYGNIEFKIQGYAELKTYRQTELVEFENTRVWLTNVFFRRYLNKSIRGEMKKDILKRVIINGSKGSSWLFKRFNKLQVIVSNKTVFKNVLLG